MTAPKEPVAISGPGITLRSLSTDAPPRSCILLGLVQGKLHIRSDQWIEPSSRVRAQFEHLSFLGEVLYCARKDTWFRVCIDLLAGQEQRREPRLPVHQHGTVITLSGENPSSEPGTLVDLAVAGMCIQLSHAVETGTMIYIETESALVAGEVRHCREVASGCFEAGVQVTDVLPDINIGHSTSGFLQNVRRKLGHVIAGEPNHGHK